MKKLLNYLRYWFCINPSWSKCRKASCWFGSNASTRIMNILSPNFSDRQFKDRVKMAADRGVDTFHVFLTNKGDGEGAPYSIYGADFHQARGVDKASAELMDRRIRHLRKQGYGVVLWLMADDSSAWSKTIDLDLYCHDIADLGWFDLASTVVVGLEADEYWNAASVQAAVAAVRKRYKGKVGVHMTSGKTSFASLVDVFFYQTSPGKTASQIASETKKALKCGKPVNFFELSRGPDRALAQAALDAGAYGVGNW